MVQPATEIMSILIAGSGLGRLNEAVWTASEVGPLSDHDPTSNATLVSREVAGAPSGSVLDYLHRDDSMLKGSGLRIARSGHRLTAGGRDDLGSRFFVFSGGLCRRMRL
jgi:hypothetical protein